MEMCRNDQYSSNSSVIRNGQRLLMNAATYATYAAVRSPCLQGLPRVFQEHDAKTHSAHMETSDMLAERKGTK